MRRTRREFLRNALLQGAAVTAAVAAGISCTQAPSTADAREPVRTRSKQGSGPPPRKQRLGVALVGLGSYSSEQLAPALQRTKHCALTGIVTRSPEKIPLWQRRYGIADRHVYNYETLARVADDDAIDVVYVVLPTSLHAKYAVIAANAGKHVWCEKPMAMDSAECERIIAACRANGVQLCIGYRMQHEPNTQTVIGYAASKPYGPIADIRALAGFHTAGDLGWRMARSMGGGALYDMGVYTINAIRYASGEEPVRVRRAQQLRARPELFTEVDETTEFELELPSGAIGYGRTSFGEDINQLRVTCKNGWYELSPMQEYTGVKGRTSDGTSLNLPGDQQQARQMDDDALAILEQRAVMVPGEEGLRDIRIVQAIIQAAKTSTPVLL